MFDYILYLGTLTWALDLAYIENRLHMLSGQWDGYLLATAVLFFVLAYRFDNRLVLSFALSSLAGWFGLAISRWPSHQDATYRQYAILYSLLIGLAGALTRRSGLKPHFFTAYGNIAANVLFWALLSGVFLRQGYLLWFLALLAAGGAVGDVVEVLPRGDCRECEATPTTTEERYDKDERLWRKEREDDAKYLWRKIQDWRWG